MSRNRRRMVNWMDRKPEQVLIRRGGRRRCGRCGGAIPLEEHHLDNERWYGNYLCAKCAKVNS